MTQTEQASQASQAQQAELRISATEAFQMFHHPEFITERSVFFRLWACGRITVHALGRSAELEPALVLRNVTKMPGGPNNDYIVCEEAIALEIRECMQEELLAAKQLHENEIGKRAVIWSAPLPLKCFGCGAMVEEELFLMNVIFHGKHELCPECAKKIGISDKEMVKISDRNQ